MTRHEPLSPDALKQLFAEARTHSIWLDKPVTDAQIHALYDLLKWGPTSANLTPARFLFVKTPDAKARLLPAMSPGNLEKTRLAPVTVIVAEDAVFYDKATELFPGRDMGAGFRANRAAADETARRNSSLQGAYLILAARALGLDAGPMSGFDAAKVDAEFFAGTTWRSNFIVNLGYGDDSKVFPRLPRLAFESAAKIV